LWGGNTEIRTQNCDMKSGFESKVGAFYRRRGRERIREKV